jgi:hypothetical protein
MNMESGIFLRSTNPETFIERCETLLLTAQVAKLKISEAVKCSDFLRALPASSDNLRSEWRTQAKFASAEEDKNFDALSQIFNTHVLQLQRQKEKEQPTVIFAGRQRRQDERRECWNCGGKGHFSTRCPKSKIGDGRSHRPAMDRSKAKPTAKIESDSKMDDVMALFGDESLVGAVTRVSDGIEEHSAMLAAVQQKMAGKILWVIDSGATVHVCKDCPAFYSIKPCASPMRYGIAGNDVVSEEEGIVAMQLPESKKLVLQDVTYLPPAPANLLSLGTLQQKGWTLDFANGYIGLGSYRIRMYNVKPKGKQQKGKDGGDRCDGARGDGMLILLSSED